MHSYGWVILPSEPEDLEAAVQDVMCNYYSEYGYFRAQVGGYWTGVIDYPNPRKNPQNYRDEPCFCCTGKGLTKGSPEGPVIVCFCCGGRGHQLKDPGDWVSPPRDFRATKLLDPEAVFVPFEVFTAEECFTISGSMEDWVSELRALLRRYPDGFVLAIDCRS